MVSGNIYETFNNIIEIENAQHNAYRGIFPAVLFDNVEVAGD
jgi:predicted Zn-dependent protease